MGPAGACFCIFEPAFYQGLRVALRRASIPSLMRIVMPGRGDVIIKAASAPAVLRREFTRLNAVTDNKATDGPRNAGPR
jgi:hypothetical protein